MSEPVESGANDATETAPSPAADRPRGSRSLIVAFELALATLIVIGCGVWLSLDPPPTPQEAEYADRQQALAGAGRFAMTLVSFNGQTAEQDVRALTETLSEGEQSPCLAEAAKVVPAVRDDAAAKAAAQHKQQLRGSVEQRAVESIDDDSATVMLIVPYVVEATVNGDRGPIAEDTLRLRVDLAEDGDDWLVSSCADVSANPSEGSQP